MHKKAVYIDIEPFLGYFLMFQILLATLNANYILVTYRPFYYSE